MKRNIITIDEEKCNGCGVCIPGCPEGALQIIDEKARLVSDLFCDGLGACIGECPQSAIAIEEREAEPYDEVKVMENIVKHGENTVKAHLKHLLDHNENDLFNQAVAYLKEKNYDIPSDFGDESTLLTDTEEPCACSGSAPISLEKETNKSEENTAELSSELLNWPVQLQLINPNAQYFRNADLVIAADCVSFSYADFHRKFLKDKVLIIFCPKLDRTIEDYILKLTEIFKNNDVQSISIVRMEVPCCGGVGKIIEMALQKAGRNIPVESFVISINGEVINEMAVPVAAR